jgi:hypothetical protein
VEEQQREEHTAVLPWAAAVLFLFLFSFSFFQFYKMRPRLEVDGYADRKTETWE